MKKLILSLIVISISISLSAGYGSIPCSKKKKEKEVIEANINGKGYTFEIEFIAGKGHNNPSFAIWIETMEEEFVQEIFVTKAVSTGIYRYADPSSGKWEAGEKMYYATLPYFIHKRTKNAEIPNSDKPIVDAYTGATPKSDFILISKSDTKTKGKFRLLLEINQAWDFNNFWHNAKFPEYPEYHNSCQPSLVYAVTIDPENIMEEYIMNPIGHGHYAGLDGNLYTDLSTFTTALKIAQMIKVVVKE
ncbi:MAG TPA: hypothetical protein PLL66_05360 [Bacteroidales bacterium]|nr:hypothetical protein [Bacteroidales bacterium]